MERIIQIAVFPETKDLYGELVTLTSEGRIFKVAATNSPQVWKEIPLPHLHADEIDHEAKGRSCSQCMKEENECFCVNVPATNDDKQ